jgi:two-component system LytT family sensor kinase
MNLGLGALVGIVVAGALLAVWRAARAQRLTSTPEALGMQSALHAATSTLPHLRRGLNMHSAARAVPHLRRLTGAAAIALADTRAVLAIEGEGREHVRPGDLLSRLLASTPDDRMHIVPRLISSDPSCPLRAAVLAPLMVQERRAGTLITFYRTEGRPSHDELRVVAEAASLVSAQVELSVLPEQEERLAQAELRALRAQISPHFIYNALAAVAGNIHARPEEAREQLIDFAEFTRYLFRDGRSYVTLADELEHVERYLRLEQARFPESLEISFDIPPACRHAVVPVLSVQPLVENAVRHGVEQRAGAGRIAIAAVLRDNDVELRVRDDGSGIDPHNVPALLAGSGGGIGLANVDARLRATFGERYALRIESRLGAGTTAIMTVPNLVGDLLPTATATATALALAVGE